MHPIVANELARGRIADFHHEAARSRRLRGADAGPGRGLSTEPSAGSRRFERSRRDAIDEADDIHCRPAACPWGMADRKPRLEPGRLMASFKENRPRSPEGGSFLHW